MKYFNFLAAILLAILYSLGNIPPSERFNLWLVSFIIPVALAFNLLLLLAGILWRKKSSLFLLAALIFGSDYLFSTIGIKSIFQGHEASQANTFTVLNYNLGAFYTRYIPGLDHLVSEGSDSAVSVMKNHILNSEADIQCYQEFPYSPSSDDPDILKVFRNRGFDYYLSADTNIWNDSRFGILIVSRFPIVGQGNVMTSENGFNRIAFADVRFNTDTIRIINVHLQSMQMKKFHPGYAENFEDQSRDIRIVLRKLKSGVFERSRQVQQLIDFIEASPYPIVCAGDFNELPYGYSYQRLKEHIHNTFEERGKGFGFTYNGKTLNMLRIDNQFYSDPLIPVDFQTLDTVRYTDHFPLLGTYSMPLKR